MYEHVRQKKIESWAFFAIGILCFVFAFDQAWQDEHNNVKVLIGEKTVLWQERDFWKDQSYAKDASVRGRDELLEKNYGVLADTQSSLTKLSNRLLDVAGPAPLKIDAHRWQIPTTYTYQNVGKVQFWILVVTSNKMINPAKGTITCDADFHTVDIDIITHGNVLRAGYDSTSPRSVHVEFAYPPLTAENPLVFFVFTREGTVINDCSFKPDK